MPGRLISLAALRTNAARLPGMAAWFVSALLLGCHSPSHYVSPRVIGRVLDGSTQRPIAGVAVKRVLPDYEAGTLQTVKGGEDLQSMPSVVSRADGAFDLDSTKSVALFRDLAWFTVEISFSHRDYERFVTNYPARMATNSPGGEPVIQAGDILIAPRTK